jgi:hypothetical protein
MVSLLPFLLFFIFIRITGRKIERAMALFFIFLIGITTVAENQLLVLPNNSFAVSSIGLPPLKIPPQTLASVIVIGTIILFLFIAQSIFKDNLSRRNS